MTDPREMLDPNCQYLVMQHIRGRAYELELFHDFDAAKAFIGNTDYPFGQELSIDEHDLRTGKVECVLAAEWDEEIERFLVA